MKALYFFLYSAIFLSIVVTCCFSIQNGFFSPPLPLFLVFLQFSIEEEQAARVSYPKCSQNQLVCLNSQFENSSEKPDLKTGGAQHFLEKKWKSPENHKTKDTPLLRYCKWGIYCHQCFWKLLSTFLMSSLDTKGTKKNNNMTATFKHSYISSVPTTMVSGLWEAWALGPTKR